MQSKFEQIKDNVEEMQYDIHNIKELLNARMKINKDLLEENKRLKKEINDANYIYSTFVTYHKKVLAKAFLKGVL